MERIYNDKTYKIQAYVEDNESQNRNKSVNEVFGEKKTENSQESDGESSGIKLLLNQGYNFSCLLKQIFAVHVVLQ